jgi:hypothetical protein
LGCGRTFSLKNAICRFCREGFGFHNPSFSGVRKARAGEGFSSEGRSNPAFCLKAFAQAATCQVKHDSIEERSKSRERREQLGKSLSDFLKGESKIVQAGPELSVRDEHTTNLSQRAGDVHVRQCDAQKYPVERTIGEGQFLRRRNHKQSCWELMILRDALATDVGPDEVPFS